MSVRVRLVSWDEASERLLALRTVVFVHEQHVPIELERDGRDPECLHALAEDEHGEAIGAARLLPDGHIGRMAVLSAARGQGVGTQMLRALIAVARTRGMIEVEVHAQLRARQFYASNGFVVTSDEYMEAGIPHVNMRRTL